MKDAFAFIYEIALKAKKRVSEPLKFKDALAFNAQYYTPPTAACQARFKIFFGKDASAARFPIDKTAP